LPLDREDTLKKAEKLLRQGRIDAAIAEYLRVVEDQPKDWNTANTLGDLYMRAGQTPSAVAQFARIGEHFMREGFYPKAAALFKKILKTSPDHEATLLSLAEISVKQGWLADAKAYFAAVAKRRRARGDGRGADEIIIRLGEIDPADVDTRLVAARIVAGSGDGAAAAVRFRQIYQDLIERGRRPEAMDALREAVRLNPSDREGRTLLARDAMAAGDQKGAHGYLDRDSAGDDPALLLALADHELKAGRLDEARALVRKLLAVDPSLRQRITEVAWTLTSVNPQAALVYVDAIVEASIAASEFVDAASVLEEFVARVPNQIDALLRLVEVCVDGGLEATMFEAQGQLADAYLQSGQATEARVIAEDLVAREPWEHSHIDRFRKSLVLLNVPDPDAVIAERLSGQAPFMATDPFSDNLMLADDAEEPAVALRPASVEGASVPDAAPAAEAAPPAFTRTLVADEPAPPPPPVQTKPEVANPKQPGARPPVTSGHTEIDLTNILAEFTVASSAPAKQPRREDLEEVFQDFRDEVTRQSGVDDASQHMTLANTYLEMGMEDDAIQSLKKAAHSPRCRFEAGAHLARLFKGRNEIPQAIEWMERAAEAPAPSREAGLGLLYELGTTLEAVGETARALGVFMELQADAGQYRDVQDKVERLSRVQTGG
jgi:tetratricopeptide (TPR) repeat protein